MKVNPVLSIAPTRIDLAGGTIDLWPIHQILDHKATVNIGITLHAEVKIFESKDAQYHIISHDQGLRETGSWEVVTKSTSLKLVAWLLKAVWHADLPPIVIETYAKSPAGAGLGGSSCLSMAILHGLFKVKADLGAGVMPNERQMVSVAQDVEAKIIHAPTGIQDYWGGVRGRVNCIGFPAGEVDVQTFAPSSVYGLEQELIVCFSGQARASAINNWQIFKRVFDGDQPLIDMLQKIGLLSLQCVEAVKAGRLDDLLQYSHEEWLLRTQLWPNIQTDITKGIDTAAKTAGATFTRVCGAGGGGVMAVFAPPEKRKPVIEALQKAGGTVLDARIAHEGMTVKYVEN